MDYLEHFKNHKIISSSQFKDNHVSYYQINKLVSQGKIAKLNKFYYENLHYQDEVTDFIYAYAFAPSGVICMLSATSFYNLTTYRPEYVDVAIHQKKKITTLSDWPELKFWYFNEKRLNTGITKIQVCNQEIHIFDIEKTVIDIIYYRNKIGIEETKEILLNYLNLSYRNINKLYRYAKILKCEKILNTYLEVLL